MEQRKPAELSGIRAPQTPGMIFTAPVVICGQTCSWLESKDYFAFPDSPFVAQSEERQLKKYVVALGSGAVVYAVGFQCGFPNIDVGEVFRAREALKSVGF